MTSTFNAEQIFTCATDILRSADALDDQIDAFLQQIAGIGPTCGDAEPIGMLLGISTVAAEEVLVESLQSVVAGLEAIAGTVGQMATSDQQTESDNDSDVTVLGTAV